LFKKHDGSVQVYFKGEFVIGIKNIESYGVRRDFIGITKPKCQTVTGKLNQV